MSTPTLPPAMPRRHEAVQLTDSTDVAHARAAVHSKWKGRVATFLSEEKRLEEARSRKVASKTKKGRDGRETMSRRAHNYDAPSMPTTGSNIVPAYFGPYKTSELGGFEAAYVGALKKGDRLGAPVSVAALCKVLEASSSLYYRKQAGVVNARYQAQLGTTELPLTRLLEAFFPLMKHAEIKSARAHLAWRDESKRVVERAADAASAPDRRGVGRGVRGRKRAELKRLFSLYDVDGSGDVDAAELIEAMKTAGMAVPGRDAAEGSAEALSAVTRNEITALLSRFDYDEGKTLEPRRGQLREIGRSRTLF